MNFARSLLELIVPPKCADSVLSLDFNEIDCFKLLISKGLSMGIVGGAVLVKVPQILTILAAQSVKGLSLISLLLEQTAILIALVYNFRNNNPFSTYGEGAFIAIQNAFIMLLILTYQQKRFSAILLLLFGGSAIYLLNNPTICTDSFLSMLQVSTIFIGIGSKLPQIYENWKNKSTGQLSIITTFLQFAGTCARVLTTLQEVNDMVLLASFLVASALNGIVLMQIFQFKSKKIKKE